MEMDRGRYQRDHPWTAIALPDRGIPGRDRLKPRKSAIAWCRSAVVGI